MKNVAILGGGITGLTCACQLAQSGHAVTVYEKTFQTGGLAGSLVQGDFVFDYGPHEFCTENPMLVALLEDLLGDDLLERHKHAAQFFNGRFIDYPLSPVHVMQQLRPGLTARIVSEVVLQRFKSLVWTSSDHSFEKWVASRFGATLYQTYFRPFTQKVWGIDPDHLDPRTASQRIAFNSIFDYVIKTCSYFFLHRNDFSSIHSPLKDKYYYSRGGIGTLTRRLAERCRELGVEFRCGHQVERLEVEEGQVKALHFTNGERVADFDYAVNTMPLSLLLASLGHPVADLPIKFRSMVFVFLEIPRPQMSPYSWIYYPDPDIIFQRSTDFAHLDAGMCPPGKTGVCLEISCFPEEEVWSWRDEQILARVRRDLEQVGVLPESVPCKGHVVRKQFIYPIQVIGYLEIVEELLKPVRGIRNLVTTGRQGLYKYCNMNECMEMALEVADQIEAEVDDFAYQLESNWRGAGLEQERALPTAKKAR
ncbi:MAG: FAD-dependent oxidoreductase [Candidatus Latescibacteria bacterium]|nr:FAD-dependent oxidoreductase [Candidatus Latescibacterota bacterium]